MDGLGRAARSAALELALSSGETRNRGLAQIAARIRGNAEQVLAANRADQSTG
jgi:gamma-glutamyl phosphate reductase